MTDNKNFLGDEIEMMRTDDGDIGPKISQRSMARPIPPTEDPLQRELRDPVTGESAQSRMSGHYGRPDVSRRPPPPPEYTERAPRTSPARQPSSTVNWLMVALGMVAVAGISILGTWYVMANRLANAPAEAKAVEEPVKNTFWQQAQDAGAKACTKAVSEMGDLMTRGSSYAVQPSFNKDNADQHVLQMIAGQTYGPQDAKTQGASLLFAAPINGQCEGSAVRVVPVTQSCAQMAQSRAVQGASKPQDLSGVSIYEFANNGTRILLIPAPNDTCTVVSVIRSAS